MLNKIFVVLMSIALIGLVSADANKEVTTQNEPSCEGILCCPQTMQVYLSLDCGDDCDTSDLSLEQIKTICNEYSENNECKNAIYEEEELKEGLAVLCPNDYNSEPENNAGKHVLSILGMLCGMMVFFN